jgi:environmental stress-induced protein Ves
MILSKSITISHKGQYTKQLNKFDIDEFLGDWETTSKGKCTDFNLMIKGATRGNLNALQIEKEKRINLKTSANPDWLFIYIFSGEVKVDINYENYTIKKGDLLAINELTVQNIALFGLENSEIVLTEIRL